MYNFNIHCFIFYGVDTRQTQGRQSNDKNVQTEYESYHVLLSQCNYLIIAVRILTEDWIFTKMCQGKRNQWWLAITFRPLEFHKVETYALSGYMTNYESTEDPV